MMFKEQMDKMKSLIIKNSVEKNDKKKIENLAFFLVVLIITLIVINAILKDNGKKKENIDSPYKELAKTVATTSENTSYDELEKKMEHILGTISGVRKSKCTYKLFTNFRNNCNV